MSEHRFRDDNVPPLTAEDSAFVRSLAEHYRPPEPTPAERRAFRLALDERVRRRGVLPWQAFPAGLAAASLAAAALLWQSLPEAPLETGARGRGQVSEASPEEALIVLAMPVAAADDSLPEDYEAIADLFLGEV